MTDKDVNKTLQEFEQEFKAYKNREERFWTKCDYILAFLLLVNGAAFCLIGFKFDSYLLIVFGVVKALLGADLVFADIYKKLSRNT